MSLVKQLKLNPKDPNHLYQLMNAVTLASARIRAEQALRGARGLQEGGYTSPDKVLKASYWDKVHNLTTHGYARFDESKARFLEHNAKLVRDKYNSDLTSLLKLPPKEFKLKAQEFKGIGPKGAKIFLREVRPHMKTADFRDNQGYINQTLKDLRNDSDFVPSQYHTEMVNLTDLVQAAQDRAKKIVDTHKHFNLVDTFHLQLS